MLFAGNCTRNFEYNSWINFLICYQLQNAIHISKQPQNAIHISKQDNLIILSLSICFMFCLRQTNIIVLNFQNQISCFHVQLVTFVPLNLSHCILEKCQVS